MSISRQLAARVVDILFMEGIGPDCGGYESVGELVRDLGSRPDVRTLVEGEREMVRKLASTVAASRRDATADDLFQTGMEYAVRLAPSYRPELGASFQTFIYLRVRRAMFQALKRDTREQPCASGEDAAREASPEDRMLVAEERARLRSRIEAILATLDEIDCKLVRACHWEELSLAEAARSVGLEYGRARYRFNIAMSTMRRKLRAA